MKTLTLKQMLMRKKSMSAKEADKKIAAARREYQQHLNRGEEEAASEVCQTHFGLNASYLNYLS